MTPSPTKSILIIRGDLVSNSGYSKALRAHAAILAPQFDRILGVDLHPNPCDNSGSFEGGVIQDDSIDQLCQESRVTILNYCLPELFIRHPKAQKNIGLFYWETDRLNPKHNWSSYLNLMDEIWMPSRFNEPMILNAGFKGVLKYFPWPITFDPLSPRDLNIKGFSFEAPQTVKFGLISHWFKLCDRLPLPPGCKRLLLRILKTEVESFYNAELRQFAAEQNLLFLNVLQTSARKGFWLTISEWFEFLEKNPSCKAGLILKLNPLKHDTKPSELLLEICSEIHLIAKTFNLREFRLLLVTNKITDMQMEGLYSKTSALISTTLGEGFGGPMAESLARSIPVIIPRHSSLSDLISPEYPFAIPSENINVSLAQQLSYYSLSSRWGVINPGALLRQLEAFSKIPKPSQAKLGADAQQFFLEGQSAAIREFL